MRIRVYLHSGRADAGLVADADLDPDTNADADLDADTIILTVMLMPMLNFQNARPSRGCSTQAYWRESPRALETAERMARS